MSRLIELDLALELGEVAGWMLNPHHWLALLSAAARIVT
jgi:hypothetical protein